MTEKELLALGAAGTKRVLMVLVARQAQLVERDVVGNLKRSVTALDHLHTALRTLVQAYWASSNLSAEGISPVLCDIEPGDKVDRLGVALYAVPQAAARLTKGILHQIAHEIECALMTLRRISYELCADGDLFVDEPGLICRRPEWLTDGEVVNTAIVPLVRLRRRHEAYLQIAERAARALEMADVRETSAKFARTVTLTGVIDGHSWSRREFVVQGSLEGDATPSSLAGTQRIYTFTVDSEKHMAELLRLACERTRHQFALDVYEKVIDGGEVRQEFALRSDA
jgi:hypothetical protein